MFEKFKQRLTSNRVIARWLARDSYKTQKATASEMQEMREALGMSEKEVELLELVEATAINLHAEAKRTQGKIMNLAAKMKITLRHLDAEQKLVQHSAVLEHELKRLGRKEVKELPIILRERLRKLLAQLQTEFTGVLAEAAEIKEEAAKERTSGTEVIAGIDVQTERSNAISKAYARIKKSANKVTSDLGKIEGSCSIVTKKTVDAQTRLNGALGKFEQKAA